MVEFNCKGEINIFSLIFDVVIYPVFLLVSGNVLECFLRVKIFLTILFLIKSPEEGEPQSGVQLVEARSPGLWNLTVYDTEFPGLRYSLVDLVLVAILVDDQVFLCLWI